MEWFGEEIKTKKEDPAKIKQLAKVIDSINEIKNLEET